MTAVTDEIFASWFAVLQGLFNDMYAREAARNLASISSSIEPEAGLGRLWGLISNSLSS
ncbi:hypothetical protein N7508_005780 [Penicillium antarcticum]|uniref:uncharacterized protein n=1 Tax=Penicillium antarcticum TaxID=416450 RepID=UPI002383ED83|nr:uncharacterized protein N7508_005780 [Penicillium antarcticum]KAJ5306765.1 hypothetical protein N7508_005780 [Penicillium antarcticum]